ncbi:cytochrome P450 [Tricharina praecox]|uniref:cytochrome P450 n=1 Tax=Tricharina praecox TaxID=43433 RepID=UPI00221FE273|nr:cytochrome P450 [Tricharina praecox]KAI5846839.1 cytochrome P450 [Tricharina praecox]
MVRACDELGDTWGYKLFGTRTIITRDPRNIQAMLATQFDDYKLATDRDAMHQLLGTKGIFTQNGQGWKNSRALLRPNFDRAQVAELDRLELFFEQMHRRIEAVAGENRCVEMQELYKKLTMDSSSDFLVGSPVGSLFPDADDKGGVSSQTFSEAFDVAEVTIATRWALSNLYWLYSPKRFRVACAAVRGMIRGYVVESLQVRAEKKKGQNRYVFLDALADTTQEPQVLQDQVLSVLLAGRDTTSALLSWTTLCLSRHPAVQNKLRAAIAATVGVGASAKIPTQEELRSITYLKWVLNEVLRCYPPLHANTRCARVPTTLPYGGGLDGNSPISLMPNEKVVYSSFCLQRRKDLYGEDADEFRPERWGEEKIRKIGWAYIPFNGGPRTCLGQQLALTHASYFLTRLLQTYDVLEEDPEFEGLDIKYDSKINMSSGRGVHVKLA